MRRHHHHQPMLMPVSRRLPSSSCTTSRPPSRPRRLSPRLPPALPWMASRWPPARHRRPLLRKQSAPAREPRSICASHIVWCTSKTSPRRRRRLPPTRRRPPPQPSHSTAMDSCGCALACAPRCQPRTAVVCTRTCQPLDLRVAAAAMLCSARSIHSPRPPLPCLRCHAISPCRRGTRPPFLVRAARSLLLARSPARPRRYVHERWEARVPANLVRQCNAPPSLAIARFLNISRSQSLVCHRMPPSHSHRELDARRSVVADRSRDLEISNPTWLDIFCAPRSFVRFVSFRFVCSSSAKMPHPSSRQPRSARFRRSLWFVCFVRRQRPLLDLDRFFISVTRPS